MVDPSVHTVVADDDHKAVLDEVRASQARHRSSLVLRCIEDHAAERSGAAG